MTQWEDSGGAASNLYLLIFDFKSVQILEVSALQKTLVAKITSLHHSIAYQDSRACRTFQGLRLRHAFGEN